MSCLSKKRNGRWGMHWQHFTRQQEYKLHTAAITEEQGKASGGLNIKFVGNPGSH